MEEAFCQTIELNNSFISGNHCNNLANVKKLFSNLLDVSVTTIPCLHIYCALNITESFKCKFGD